MLATVPDADSVKNTEISLYVALLIVGSKYANKINKMEGILITSTVGEKNKVIRKMRWEVVTLDFNEKVIFELVDINKV